MSSNPVPSRRHGFTRRGLWVALPLALIGVGLSLVIAQWTRAREASAAMADAPNPAPIDGTRAYKYLKQICEIGPRPAGSAANAKQRAMVARHFKAMGAVVTEQPFTGTDPRGRAEVSMVNLVGSWHPERVERVVIGAHYDTRPFPDEERDPARRTLPFLGANDGASGVALLMEIAHHMDRLSTPWGVDLVLFDGEELVYGQGQDQNGEYFLGAKEFARVYVEGVDSRRLKSRYVAGIVLDMVGDKDLKIDQEENSLNLAHGLVRDVWAVANRLKATAFRNRVGSAVLDDHLALNNAGIPSIDIIDFDYPYWHTSRDLPEHCSAASLEQVGRVVTAWLAQPKRGR
ncbi:MAG: M28 family peptidase [Planctomycetia bacterium]|nr:M28 family peptidase [Planctomycetia bacterium]